MPRRLLALALATCVLLPLTACGDDDDPPEASASEAPAEDRPERIVSIAPAATEILYAVGAGDQVVAVDDFSNHPEGAPMTDLSGHDPNVEAIASYEPDLVLLSNDTNDVVAGLEALDIEVLLTPAPDTIDEIYEQFEDVGAATGHEDEATDLVHEVRSSFEDAIEAAAGAGTGLTYYWELDPTYYSVTSRTFMGQIAALLGLENIADEAQADAGDYPQLSAEFILGRDPDLIVLADTKCCQQSAESVAARPGWGHLKAVVNGGVIALDDDIASRWGPRIVELAEALQAGIEKVTASR